MADTGRAAVLRVEVLGPLRVVVDGAPVEVPGPKRRAVLALLALAEGRTVSVDRLVDALWPGEMPDSGRQALHTHVSRLRTHLGPAASRLQTRHDGYRLDLAADELDLGPFGDLPQVGAPAPVCRTQTASVDPVGVDAAIDEMPLPAETSHRRRHLGRGRAPVVGVGKADVLLRRGPQRQETVRVTLSPAPVSRDGTPLDEHHPRRL